MRGWDLSECIITAHFREKREVRGVPWEAIAETLRHPWVVEPHQGRHRVVRGRLALVVADLRSESPVLVSLLLRGIEERWTDDHARSLLKA